MAKKRNLLFRKYHRDIGYFVSGILMSYAISGIALNHRKQWNPSRYIYQTKAVHIAIPPIINKSNIENTVVNWVKENQLTNQYRKHRIKNNQLRIALENGTVEVNLATGNGELELTKKRPVLGQMVSLHKLSSNFWIWYADIYALAILFLVGSGLVISKGKFSFQKRGWKLLLLGICFPLLIIIFNLL